MKNLAAADDAQSKIFSPFLLKDNRVTFLPEQVI